MTVLKDFGGTRFWGTIIRIDDGDDEDEPTLYRIKYDDGDEEDLEYDELIEVLTAKDDYADE